MEENKEYTFFSLSHRTFSKIDHMLGQEARINRYKEIEITPCILYDHHELKLDIINNINGKECEFMEAEQLILKKNWIKTKNQEANLKCFKTEWK